jgi:hypothetical protein
MALVNKTTEQHLRRRSDQRHSRTKKQEEKEGSGLRDQPMKGKMIMKYTFIDIEAAWDEQLHEAYRQIDPVGAGELMRNGQQRRRLPCKRVMAAAAFDLELHEDGAISILGLTSWTTHDHGGEREVVANMFEHVRARPATHVVTYSGLAAELPLLTLAAMEHKLVLPPQLRTGVPVFLRPGMWRPHIDLALELKGQGRDWAHLSEIGLRLGLPGELFTGKAHIAEPNTGEEWQAMRARVSMDCVVTAMIALSFWRANGRIQLDQVAMLHHVASWCQRNTTSDAYREPLVELRRQTLVQIVEQEAEPV